MAPPRNGLLTAAGMDSPSPSAASPEGRRASRRVLSFTAATLTLVTAVGAVLRFHLLGAKSLWLDEGVSVWLASIPLSRFLHAMVSTPELNMVLYYTVLRGWLHFGQSEFIIRALSATFGVAAVPVLYLLGRRIFGPPAGLIAAALLATHSFHLRYSQEARGYALEVLLLILSTLLFAGIVDSPSRRTHVWAYALTSAAAVYCHIFAVLVVGSHWLALDRAKWKAIGWRNIASIAGGLAALLAPFAAHLLLRPQQGLSWIPRPTAMFFLGTMRYLTGSADSARVFTSLGLTLLYVLFCSVPLWTFLFRTDSASAAERFGIQLSLSWIVTPVLVTLLVSVIAKPLFFSRFLLMCVPPLTLLAAQGMVQFARIFSRRGVVLVSVSALMLFFSLSESYRYFRDLPFVGHDWRDLTRYVLDHERPGDAVVISMGREPFEYYVGRELRAGAPAPDVFFPPELGAGDRNFNAGPVLASACNGHRTVWVVFQGPLQNAIRSAIPRSCQSGDEEVFSGYADAELRVLRVDRR